MTKTNDFSCYLAKFLCIYLPGEKGVSSNTVASYKDTFILLLLFMKEKKKIPAEKITLEQLSAETICEFLAWLEESRGSSAATRNIRLAAIRSYFKFVQYQDPGYIALCQEISAIPLKKTAAPTVNYLSLEGIRCLLEEPDLRTASGRRDLALLSLMYCSGARVQEIIDLTPADIHLDFPYTVKLTGKGSKSRIVPLMEEQIKHLRVYMEENRFTEPGTYSHSLFANRQGNPLTRAGINYILSKYAAKARKKHPGLIPEKLSCHCLRHSIAMHLLQSGVNLVYIRDILGHTSVQVTEIYARADSKQKREAIEKAYTDVMPGEEPIWLRNNDLLSFLKSFR